MDSEKTNYKDFFSSTSSPANYSAVVANITKFIENHLKSDRRIVLVTVSYKCFCFADAVTADVYHPRTGRTGQYYVPVILAAPAVTYSTHRPSSPQVP